MQSHQNYVKTTQKREKMNQRKTKLRYSLKEYICIWVLTSLKEQLKTLLFHAAPETWSNYTTAPKLFHSIQRKLTAKVE